MVNTEDLERWQTVVQSALALRDELPDLLGDECVAADRELAELLGNAVRALSAETVAAIIKFVGRWPEVKRRFNAILSGGWRGTATAGAAPERPSACEVVEVLYATDRKPAGRPQPEAYFSGERSPADTLAFGKCAVSVPFDRKRGSLPRPGLLWPSRGDPNKHVLLLSIEPLDQTGFRDSLQARIGADDAPAAFVFIHGYNVAFSDAVRRTAQLHADLNFPGAPICFSWPSRGSYLAYGADSVSARWAAPHLAELLRNLRTINPALRVHLVAHSMGSDVMARAVQEMSIRGENPKRFLRQIVLAAADIDRDVFDQLAAAICDAAERVTLYASSNDRALWLSKMLHWGPRAGDSDSDLVICEGMDTIDASRVDSSLLTLRHSYFADRLSVLSDLTDLIRHGTPPSQRAGIFPAANAPHWVLQP